jgi:hypothetical protein
MSVLISSPNNQGWTLVFDFILDTTRCTLLCESMPIKVITIPIPESITTIANMRPTDVTG